MQTPSVSLVVNYDDELLKQYTINKKISNGSFGTVFNVTNKQTNIKSALKIELLQAKIKPTLKKQAEIMKLLKNIEGVPKMYASGKTDKVYFLELQLLDKDLSCFIVKNIPVSISYLCELTVKLLNILQSIHEKGVIHRDLKPQNIMLHNDNVYLIDFGISQVYPNPNKKRAFVGTPRYASVAAHKGVAQTPVDEIQSLITLPWMDIHKKQNKMDSIQQLKMNFNKEELCKGMPSCFYQTFDYLKEKQPSGTVDYNYIRDLFVDQLKSNYQYDIRHADGTSMSLPHPQIISKQQVSRRRFSQMDPQVLGLLLKQRQLKNGGKRQSVQSNFLTIPQSQNDIRTPSFNTIQLVTTQKAVASNSKQQKDSILQNENEGVNIDEHSNNSKQFSIQNKIKNYCLGRQTRGSRRTETIEPFQFT